MSTIVRLLAALGVVALTTCLAAPAQAHASLVASSPRQGEALDQLPAAVSFEFSDPVLEPAYVVVTAPDGDSVTRGEVAVDGTVVRQELGDGADGSYSMAYRVVSEDGHPISGEITFSVGSPTTGDDATAVPADRVGAPDAVTNPATAGASPSDGGGPGVGAAVAVALFGGAGLLLVLSRRAAP